MLVKDFYTIEQIKTEEEMLVVYVQLNSRHPIYDGHFPEQAVVPGVMSLLIIREIVEVYLHKKLRLTASKNIKFSSVILPREMQNLRFRLGINNNEKTKSISVAAEIFSEKDVCCLKSTLIFEENAS